MTDWRCGNCGAVHYDLPPTQRCSFCGRRALDGENGLFEATIILCARCLSGAGGECHQPGCALWMSRAPDVALWSSPMVMFRPAPEPEQAGPANVPVRLERRSLPGQLRYLAHQLTEGTDSASVALALEVAASEQDRIMGYRIDGRLHDPADVEIVRRGP